MDIHFHLPEWLLGALGLIALVFVGFFLYLGWIFFSLARANRTPKQ